MKRQYFLIFLFYASFFMSLEGIEKKIPENMLKIMQQPKYKHARWGIFAKDVETGNVLIDLHSNELFLPGSVTKLFSTAALLHAYGDNYRFKTPVYKRGVIEKGVLKGDLILVGQGDLTLGGRQNQKEVISFTEMDHIYANDLPGATITKEDPLYGLKMMAKQIREKEIKEIQGNILVDERLFEKTEKRGMILTPIMINENLIDIVINPTNIGQAAALSWRPVVTGYTVINKVKTISVGEPEIQITSDDVGRNIIVEGSISLNQKTVLRIFPVKDPQHFARAAFIDALRSEGIAFQQSEEKEGNLPPENFYQGIQPVAVWISPTLSEYTKLILKVSHNLGADLIPLLLASQKGKKTFDEGMFLLGEFVERDLKIARGNFVFVDAGGGDNNRLTPQATVKLLENIQQNLPAKQFEKFYLGLPILGIDGSLATFGKGTDAVGKVYAKTGTGVSYNLATRSFFLTTQALAGYIKGKNGHLIEFMIAVNNAEAPEIKDLFPIFEDQAQMTAILFSLSDE